MYGFFVVIIVIASILITIAVLLQNSKGGGLASNFGAGNQTFGVRQAADILEKATWWFAAIIKTIDTKGILEKKPASSVPTFPIQGQGEAAPVQEAPAQETPAE